MNKKFSFIAVACVLLAGQVLALDPRLEQGARFEAQGNYEMALGEYRAMLAENSKNAEAYLAAANVRMKMNDLSGALANYRLAYKFDPNMSAAYEGAAKVYEALGSKSKADAERAKDPKNRPAESEATASAPAATPEAVAPATATVAPAAAEPAPKAEAAAEVKVEPAKDVKAAEPVKAEPKAEEKKVEEKKVAAAPAEPAKAVEPKAEPAPVAKTETKAELPADPFEKGKALFAAGKYAEAAPLWREVLRKTPGHAGAYFYAGLTRFELGEYEKAEFNLKKGLEYKDEGIDANYYLARIYEKSKKTDLEKKFLSNYLKKAAPNGKFRRKAENRLAELESAKTENAQKSEEQEVAKSEGPDEKSEPVKQASAPAQSAAAPEATTAVEELSQELSIATAIAKFREGNLEEALQSYKSLLETEQNPEERYFTLLQMGNIYREMRDFHSAVTRYREVVQQFPDSDWATEAERALEDAVWLEKHSSELPRKK